MNAVSDALLSFLFAHAHLSRRHGAPTKNLPKPAARLKGGCGELFQLVKSDHYRRTVFPSSAPPLLVAERWAPHGLQKFPCAAGATDDAVSASSVARGAVSSAIGTLKYHSAPAP